MIWFLKGLIIGFSIAAPVGPIGLLCIRRTLNYGRWSGFISGVGAATADTLYGLIALLGINWVADLLISNQFWLQPIGGLFMILLGIRTFCTLPQTGHAVIKRRSSINDFTTTFILTLTNPLTIFSFAAIFAGIGLGDSNINYISDLSCATGVFTGSLLWWTLLSEGLTLFRHKVSSNLLSWINRVSGSVIIAFGAIALLMSSYIC